MYDNFEIFCQKDSDCPAGTYCRETAYEIAGGFRHSIGCFDITYVDNTNTCENESTRAWIGSKAPLTLTETFTRAEYSSYISTIAKSSTNNFDLPHIIKCNAPEKNISPEIDLSSADFMHTLIIWICLCSCCIACCCGCVCTFRLQCFREDEFFKSQGS